MVDGQPFFMIASWEQCAADVDENLALGVNTFVGSLCDEQLLSQALAGRAYMIGGVGGNPDLPAEIGYLQPDEPDVHGIAPSALSPPPMNGKITVLNVSMNFWDGAKASGFDYPAAFEKADVLSTDVYPVEEACNQAPWVTLETPYDVQLQLSATGKPSGQWLETNAINGECPDTLTPAMVQAEAWEVIEGGGNWIGWFFPAANGDGSYTSFDVAADIASAISTFDQHIKTVAPILLSPRLDVSTPWGNGQPTGPGSNPVKVGGRLFGGQNYLFATNTTGSRITWTRSLPGLGPNEVVTEAVSGLKLVATKSGQLEDTFQPYETRIYSWTPESAPQRRKGAVTKKPG